MNKSIFKIILSILVLFISFSCAETKTNRELFNESLEKNIIAGVKPLMDSGVDSVIARKYITCILETMYQIDSTFFLKNPDVQKEIYLKNEVKFQQCESYIYNHDDSLRHAVKAILK